ncbi:putative neutral zinc metallopeptidase [compost metagenome]
MEEALKAVIAQGEEHAKTQGQPPMPDPLTLGGSEIRMRWLQLGMETGDPRECSQLITGEEQ